MAVILAAGDGDQGCADEGREGEEDAGKVGTGAEDVHLACEKAGREG